MKKVDLATTCLTASILNHQEGIGHHPPTRPEAQARIRRTSFFGVQCCIASPGCCRRAGGGGKPRRKRPALLTSLPTKCNSSKTKIHTWCSELCYRQLTVLHKGHLENVTVPLEPRRARVLSETRTARGV